MKYRLFVGVLYVCLLVCTVACRDKFSSDATPDWMKNTYPEYDEERQVIYFKEQLRKDILCKLDILADYPNMNLVSSLSFFNYGGDICLCKTAHEDYFIESSLIGILNYAYVLNSNDSIEITNIKHSDKYGDWAVINLTINNVFLRDVFMTPLAMKAYNEGDKGFFIFIQIVANNKHMNVLFVGEVLESIVVGDFPNFINRNQSEFSLNIDRPNDGPGQFWHPNEVY